MSFQIRKCGKICLLFVILTGGLCAQPGTVIDTLDENMISEIEFNAFWSEFKDFCQSKDTSLVGRFIAPIVTKTYLPYEQGLEHSTYPLDKIVELIREQEVADCPLPVWQPEMDSIRIGHPLLRYPDQRTVLEWGIGPSYEDPEHVYNYAIYVGGPVSISTYYYFKKFNGEIKFFKTYRNEY
jgi:hypothetical protein